LLGKKKQMVKLNRKREDSNYAGTVINRQLEFDFLVADSRRNKTRPLPAVSKIAAEKIPSQL
jgi:hypothetical protein